VPHVLARYFFCGLLRERGPNSTVLSHEDRSIGAGLPNCASPIARELGTLASPHPVTTPFLPSARFS
jgi:hypothetical protein